MPSRPAAVIRELVLHIRDEAAANALLSTALESLAQSAPESSGHEAWIKRELRRVHGKAADFLPYLFESVCTALGCSQDIEIRRAPSLAAMVAATERLLGSKTRPVIEDSLRQYIAENDVSYRLKSA